MSVFLFNSYGVPSSSSSGSSGSDTLIGVGSPSNSLTNYPKITNTTTGDWYVDGSVGSSGAGTTLGTAFKTIAEGLSALSSGETLLVKGGTYSLTGLSRSTGWASETRIMGYGDDRPVLDFASGSSIGISFSSGASNETWHRFHVKNSAAEGIRAPGGTSNITLSDMHVSHSRNAEHSTGIRGNGTSNLTIKDCVVWRLGNGSETGTNAPDCYVISYGGTGQIVRCVATNGPDDCYDLWAAEGVDFVDSVAYGAGRYWNGNNASEGNGFKMGGGGSFGATATGCISINNKNNGFHNNASSNSVYTANTAWDGLNNGFRCDLGGGDSATYRDNLAGNNAGSDLSDGANNPDDTYNSWNSSADAGGNAAFPLSEVEIDLADTANWDYSLDSASEAISAGVTGENMGASTVALELALEWIPYLIGLGEAN